MTYTFYHYPRCSTCVKAKKWLDAQGIKYQIINLADQPPTIDQLRDIHKQSGKAIKALFNTSGQSYRGGNFKDRLPKMSADEQFTALAADGMLIKRPILVGGQPNLIGFKVAEWEQLFNQ